MGNKNSSPDGASAGASSETATPPVPPSEEPKKKEFVTDNAFSKADDAHFERITKGSTDKKLSSALSFDDRKLLTAIDETDDAPAESEEGGTRLHRATTFVGKETVERADSFALNDVVYRQHFGVTEDENTRDRARSRAFSHPVQYEGIISTPDTTVAPLPLPPAEEKKDEAIVIVDCFSTGAVLAYRCFLMGYKIINLSSIDLGELANMLPEGIDFQFSGAMIRNEEALGYEGSIEALITELKALKWPVKAIVPGAETGVELADELSSRMGLRTNGTSQSTARRNKYVMGETVRKAGIRAVRQLEVTTWEEIKNFIDDWNPTPFKVIAKPMDSAGSEDVTLCRNMDELRAAFGKIIGKKNLLGLINKSMLVQEYLEGIEYVVDMVSKDGEHKLTGLWEYDRRPTNGASFVLHGQRFRILEDCPEKYIPMVEYQKKVITALGIKNGPSHGEVKWCKGEPVLVEVGSRCHGGEGLWVNIAEEAVGVSQVQSTADVYVGDEALWANTADAPSRIKHADLKWLVSYKAGTLRKINEGALAEIMALSSYRGHQFFVKPGQKVKKTLNYFTFPGCITLCNEDEETLNNDFKRIEQLQMDGLFDIEEDEEPTKLFVGVVDPFSTGANVAAEFYRRGFAVVAVYSGDMDKLGGLQSLVPEGLELVFHSIQDFKEDPAEMVKELSAKGAFIAIVAGAETGVELADDLSSRMKLRSNGTELSTARRNKYIMGETVRKAGIRAVKQLQSQDWDSIREFISEWKPDPFRVIVKPMDSAGSEDVTLCHSIDEVKAAFSRIIGKKNGLGLINHSVLVQEYLEGTEYVIDACSRDGVHKVISIWEYDRRPINGASFVLYGQALRIISDDDARFTALVEYQKKVITALGIKEGPSHGEVKWCNNEPVLVEVGSRCHGNEGFWIEIADATSRCNQAVAACLSFLPDSKEFDDLPMLPERRYGDGRLVMIVAREEGVLTEINPEAVVALRELKSFHRMELFYKPGQVVKPTINCFTYGGCVILLHNDKSQLLADYDAIHEIELKLFTLQK